MSMYKHIHIHRYNMVHSSIQHTCTYVYIHIYTHSHIPHHQGPAAPPASHLAAQHFGPCHMPTNCLCALRECRELGCSASTAGGLGNDSVYILRQVPFLLATESWDWTLWP